uniref:Neurobeachin n=1 Tax=Anthurium amnicola TaxID=1678845 RepID=A0A1D1YAQ9_9ARAE
MAQLKKFLFATFLFFILFISNVYSFDPSTVNNATKQTWCNDQIATCNNICLDSAGSKPLSNTCQIDSLAYDCRCANGVQPNSTEYTQTIPYFTCTEDQQTCIKNCQATQGGPTCFNGCNANSCGAKTPKPPSQVPSTVASATPAAPGPGSPTPSKNPTTLLNAAVMVSPIQGSFMLLFTLVVIFFTRIN